MVFVDRITDKLVDYQIIKADDKELYSYGLWQGIVLIYNFATVLFIGLLFNMILESIIFMVTYGSIRSYAGGYHARTSSKCYLFSVGMMIAVLWLIKHLPTSGFICASLVIISSIIIVILAPVEDKNKPLDEIEQIVYRKRTLVILTILIGLTIAFWVLGFNESALCVSIAISAISIMLILGKVNNYILK